MGAHTGRSLSTGRRMSEELNLRGLEGAEGDVLLGQLHTLCQEVVQGIETYRKLLVEYDWERARTLSESISAAVEVLTLSTRVIEINEGSNNL